MPIASPLAGLSWRVDDDPPQGHNSCPCGNHGNMSRARFGYGLVAKPRDVILHGLALDRAQPVPVRLIFVCS
jgi:hypothetical protein